MITSSEPKPKRTDLPTIPTAQEMETWNKEKVLQWIRQREPNILEGDDLENFNKADITGSAFLLSSFEFFKGCDLSRGASLVLNGLVDEVKEGKLSNQTAGRKRKGDETDTSEPPKRNRQQEILSEVATRASERRKRIREMITDLTSSSDQHSNSVDPLPGAVDQLSDPTFERTLPFPFVGSEAPVRFKVIEGNWQYVGRTKFKELLQELKKVQESEVYSTLWLYGTQGYGKSHLLAALVCYLAAQDETVVYISDCRALIEDPVEYVRAAMLFAWADDITIQKEILTLNTLEEIENFFMSKRNVIFVIDQMNALEKEKGEKLSAWIKRFTFRNKKVYSSFPNNTDYHEQAENENQHSFLHVYGGLTEAEMDQWWKRHSDVDMGGYERRDVEDVTGCIPLLLAKCVVSRKIDLSVNHLRDIYDKAGGFVQQTRAKTMGNLFEWKWYVEYVTACFCHRKIPTGWTEHPHLIDHRYFYALEELGNPTCGLVRSAVADQLLNQGVYLADTNFLPSLPVVIDNPSIAGFMIEHAVLSSIHSNGLPIGAGIGKSMELRLLKDPPPNFEKGVTDKPVLYRPESFDFKAMDGIIVLIKTGELNDEKNATKTKKNAKKKLLMFPFQITLAPATHVDSREKFFEKYGTWITDLSQFDVEVQFLWISPECRDSQEYPASLEPKWPKHLERYIPLKDVNEEIWVEYGDARKRLLKTKAAQKRLLNNKAAAKKAAAEKPAAKKAAAKKAKGGTS